MIDAIVLDFGRVLAHFDHRRATDAIAPHTRCSAERLHTFLHTGTLAIDYEAGAITTEEFIQRVDAEVTLGLTPDEFGRLYGDIFWANDAMLEVIPTLARRYPLILLSNTCDLHARKFLVQFSDALRHFTHVIMSHEVRSRKPTPGIYAKAEQAARCKPERLLFLDDIEANVQAARSRGWQATVYLGGDPRAIFAAHGVTIDG